MNELPLVTQRQAHDLIGEQNFETCIRYGFIRTMGLKELPAELYDRKDVESAPFRMKMSFLCYKETGKQNKFRSAIRWIHTVVPFLKAKFDL